LDFEHEDENDHEQEWHEAGGGQRLLGSRLEIPFRIAADLRVW
jgi:hypothetical protein